MYEELNEWRLVHSCFTIQKIRNIEIIDNKGGIPTRIDRRIARFYEFIERNL